MPTDTSVNTAASAGAGGERARSLVPRATLLARLSAAPAESLVLIVAPAGSGKTVLLREWIESTRSTQAVAWVSVERGERDPQHFWIAVANGLHAAARDDSIVPLDSSPDFDSARLVDRLLFELSASPEPLLLVVDDLHELASPEALEELERLILLRPDHLRICLSTRHDPPLGLHKLRLAGQLVELRTADLRFSPDETRELFHSVGVELTDASIDLIHARTEGWVAGLRLAALSLTRHPDPERFVKEFSGSDRTIADYLLGEVLDRQPAEVRDMLLRTAVLERVNGSLADALTDQSGSERILLALERANAFVTSVDTDRSWFRYHHLFADLLRLQLRHEHAELVPELHRRAAGWYEQHGYALDAIRHAQRAEDWPYALGLVAQNTPSLLLEGDFGAAREVAAAFPAQIRSEPELALLAAGIERAQGSVDEAEAFLSIAEAGLASVPTARRRAFEVTLATLRLALDARRGDYGSVSAQVQALLESAPPQTSAELELSRDSRAMTLLNLGVVEYWSYQLSDAVRHLEQALELARSIPRPRVEVMALAHLALSQSTGSLTRERELAAEAIAVADARGWHADPVAVMPLAAMAAADVLQARFEEARPWLARARAALRPGVDPASELLIGFLDGWVEIGEGRLREAVATLAAAADLQRHLKTRHVVTLLAHQCLIHTQLRLGDVRAAAAILDALEPDERAEGEILVAEAHLRLEEGDPGAALALLAPVTTGETRSLAYYTVIQALIVEGLAQDRLGVRARAEEALERALDLAEPEGLIMPFAVTAPRTLLEQHPRSSTKHVTLLDDIIDALAGNPVRSRSAQDPGLLEDLTESELRVLRYLPSNLSAPEMANELYVSTSTVKTHMRHIYEKLEVHGRTDAVRRARELGLLDRAARRTR